MARRRNHLMEARKSKVGIIIRTKNRPIFLKRALESVSSQTFSNWHIYIINDGGNAEELKPILQPYEKKFSEKITSINLPISYGRGGAMSLGIGVATEDYILIHDDDDTLEPLFLEKTVSYLDADKDDVFCGVTTSNYDVYEYVDGDRIITKEKTDTGGQKTGTLVDVSIYLSHIGVILPITFLFRRKLIDLSGNVNTNMQHYEDYDLFIRLIMRGEIGIIQDFLCSYHHREPTGTASDTSRHEKKFDYHLAYRNNVIRNAINNGGNLTDFQATFIHGKSINSHYTNQILNHMQALGMSIIAMSKAISEIAAKIEKRNF